MRRRRRALRILGRTARFVAPIALGAAGYAYGPRVARLLSSPAGRAMFQRRAGKLFRQSLSGAAWGLRNPSRAKQGLYSFVARNLEGLAHRMRTPSPRPMSLTSSPLEGLHAPTALMLDAPGASPTNYSPISVPVPMSITRRSPRSAFSSLSGSALRSVISDAVGSNILPSIATLSGMRTVTPSVPYAPYPPLPRHMVVNPYRRPKSPRRSNSMMQSNKRFKQI